MNRSHALCGFAVALGILGAADATALPTTAMPGVGSPLDATPADKLPSALSSVGFDQRIGQDLPLDLTFRDESGTAVRLADYFGARPVVLVPVYFRCPMLCSTVLNGLQISLGEVPFSAGKDYTVLAVSFDPKDTPAAAREKKERELRRLAPEIAAGWHFLSTDADTVHRFTEAIGFRYAADPVTGEFAHTAGVVVATPHGVLSRYFFGVAYPSRDLRLGLVEAGDEKLGSVVDHVLLYCFKYNPNTGKYSATAIGILRIAAALTALLLAGGLLAAYLRERHRNRISLGTA